jgi:hypothetical protein
LLPAVHALGSLDFINPGSSMEVMGACVINNWAGDWLGNPDDFWQRQSFEEKIDGHLVVK